MIFSTIPFLYYFLPITLLLYFLVPQPCKNVILLAASMGFYAWGEKLLVVLFACSILLAWAVALGMENLGKVPENESASHARSLIQSHAQSLRRLLMIFITVYDLGLLAYFKYADFFIENVNRVLISTGVAGSGMANPGTMNPQQGPIALLHVALPIGISFYTFQLLSYNIDVYRGNVSAQKNPIHLAAYVSMFPQLIAGPIVRYADVADDLLHRKHSLSMIASGIQRFVVGLGKKVLIANAMGEVCANFRASSQMSVLYFWLYAVCYTLQIYYDFSGYSDMAIGLGRIFGFHFMENFDYPYISTSITEFWRRWHISLGAWFRDYVYIPLGGNRKGIRRQLINIFVVWTLTGLWHGASWNFIFWGLGYGILLTFEKIGLKKWLDQHKAVGHIYTMIFVVLGFILFNAADLGQAASDIAGLISFGRYPFANVESLYYLRSYGVLIAIGLVGATPFPRKWIGKLQDHATVGQYVARILDVLVPVFLAVILLLVTAHLVENSFNPFLYFRF